MRSGELVDLRPLALFERVDALGQMATLQKSFAATVDGLWKSLIGGISQGISRMVQNWVTAIATQSVASEMQHAREILGHAKAGAAAAYHAVVGIPIVGPILAPPAAAAAFAGIMAFSAEGGMDRVPYDGATIIAHKDEMMLSARYANPLRDMLEGGGFNLPAGLATPLQSMLSASSNTNAPVAANDGSADNHFHYHDHTDRGLTPAQIRANHVAVGDAVKMAYRKGAFVGTALKL